MSRNIRIEIEDNDNHACVYIDDYCHDSVEVHHCNQQGFYLGESFLHFGNDQEVLALVDSAIEKLNAEHGHANDSIKPKKVRKSSQAQLLWDAYSVLSHGTSEQKQNVLERLESHFSTKDTIKLNQAFSDRYPQQ